MTRRKDLGRTRKRRARRKHEKSEGLWDQAQRAEKLAERKKFRKTCIVCGGSFYLDVVRLEYWDDLHVKVGKKRYWWCLSCWSRKKDRPKKIVKLLLLAKKVAAQPCEYGRPDECPCFRCAARRIVADFLTL